MKKQLNSSSLGKGYALIWTIVGYLIGIPSFIAFDTTDPWAIILAIACVIAYIAYITIVKMVDSSDTFARAAFQRHTIVSVVSIVLSFVLGFSFDDRLGLYVIGLAFGIALTGFVPLVFHLAAAALQKRRRN